MKFGGSLFISVTMAFLFSISVWGDGSAVEEWAKMPPEKKDEVRRNYQAYQKLNPDQKNALDAKYERYKALSPEEKARVQKNYAEFKKLPPEKQRAIKLAASKYNESHHKSKGPKKKQPKKV